VVSLSCKYPKDRICAALESPRLAWNLILKQANSWPNLVPCLELRVLLHLEQCPQAVLLHQ
jgi:hypothetical protein